MATALSVSDEVDIARRRLVDLQRRAAGPMHVPQPGGGTLRMCYVGRLTRAHEMINAAPEEKRSPLLKRYEEIKQEATDAWEAYQFARSAYINACSWAGVQPQLPVEKDCDCVVCSELLAPSVHLDASVATG